MGLGRLVLPVVARWMVYLLLMILVWYSLELGGIGCCCKGLLWPLGLAEVGCQGLL